MITLRRSNERHSERRGLQEPLRCSWDAARPRVTGFDALEALHEDSLPPGASVLRRSVAETEILIYVREGALVHEDAMGGSGMIHAGEFRLMSAHRGVRLSDSNPSQRDRSHIFQLWFSASGGGLERRQDQKRFSAAERRGRLCLIASPDTQRGSLCVHQDVKVYSVILDPGQHLVHSLLPERNAWLQVVEGELTLDDIVLNTGDSVGMTAERAVSLTARSELELLLLDFGGKTPLCSA